jgi:outer membrane protein OmpA-like peptidoglycan-associated protein
MPVLAGERYTIVAQKDGYEPVEMEVTAEELTAEPEFLVEISKAPAVEAPKEKVATPVEAPAPAWKNKKVEAGAVIRLDNVYYDFDKFDIRSDAAEELDKVVDWMKKYLTLEIELGSHTDARGSDDYNMRLSQKRAEAAVVYIISKGIAGGRIKAQGYGETMLVNQCADGVECTDGEHQENRRTEIKITRLDEPGVRVED